MRRKLDRFAYIGFGALCIIGAWAFPQSWIQVLPGSVQAVTGYATIQEEGSGLTQRTIFNCIGSSITCTDDSGNSRTNLTIQAYDAIQDEGTPLTQRSTVNFTGSSIACSDSGGITVCNVSAGGSFTSAPPYISDGSNFFVTPNFILATRPVDGDFTWVNQQTATKTTLNDSITLTVPQLAGDNLNIRVHAAPGSTPWTVTAIFQPAIPLSNFNGAGITVRQASSGTLVAYQFEQTTGRCLAGSATGWSSNGAIASTPAFPNFQNVTLIVTNDGTTTRVLVSADGTHSTATCQWTNASIWTGDPDQVGFFVQSENAPMETNLTLLSWVQTP